MENVRHTQALDNGSTDLTYSETIHQLMPATAAAAAHSSGDAGTGGTDAGGRGGCLSAAMLVTS